MEFKFVDSVIDNISVRLEVLEKDSDNYTMLLFQHKGVFKASNSRFGNESDCSTKFSAFIQLAREKNVSLALTPEYSCPWNSIIEVVGNSDHWPNSSKLWALCSESITPAKIKEFKDEYANDETLIYFDEEALNNGSGVLLDPMCYLFKAHVNQEEKLIVLIQFKTQHMGVWSSPLEREKYIPGKEIYVLRNSPHSIYLFTNICSEAEKFEITETLRDDFRWDEQPYLILSPQMNPKPTDDIFKTFRKSIIDYNNKDVISLNWGGNTSHSGQNEPLISLSKSSIIFKTTDIKFDEDDERRFIKNHEKGLYYLNRKSNIHANYLNPYEEVFLITHQKTSAAGTSGSMVKRTGPEVQDVFQWNQGNKRFISIDKVDDGFTHFLNELSCTNSTLHDPQVSFIDKERLINLSCGKASSKKDDRRWYKLDKLESFFQDKNESVKRLTYIHDESGKDTRIRYIETIDYLNDNIIPKSELFPTNLVALKGRCNEVMFQDNDGFNYNYNLVTQDGEHRATVAYIGRNEHGTALKTLEQMQGIFEKDDQSRKRVVVWYKKGSTDILPVCEKSPPDIADDSTENLNSITNV